MGEIEKCVEDLYKAIIKVKKEEKSGTWKYYNVKNDSSIKVELTAGENIYNLKLNDKYELVRE